METVNVIMMVVCFLVAILLLAGVTVFLVWKNVELSKLIHAYKKEVGELRQHNRILQESDASSNGENTYFGH